VLKGSGISSSAAYEVMIGNILNYLYNEGKVDNKEIAKFSQYSENVYFGKPCGLMDQMACAVGGFVFIDFENKEAPVIEKADFSPTDAGYKLCIVNTGGNHADLNDDYASVPREMRGVAALLGRELLRGITLEEIRRRNNLNFIVSRIIDKATGHCLIADSQSRLKTGDRVLVIANKELQEKLTSLIGEPVEQEWTKNDDELISRKITFTNPKLNGTKLSKLNIRREFGVNVTRVHRASVDLAPTANFRLQVGDIITVVGHETAINDIKKMFGDERKYLDHPNLIPIFIGIALGCILGSIPLSGTLISTPLKLGLAGGPLIVAILVSYFGPKLGIVTYTTTSANLMIREIGITLFLACVGLGAGGEFVDSIVNKGGYMWILYGAIITIIPILIAGFIGRYIFKIQYNTLTGVISGSCTNPPALAFANQQSKGGDAAVGYATVYPLAMFLRILVGQMMILIFC
jgi:putative transport protein